MIESKGLEIERLSLLSTWLQSNHEPVQVDKLSQLWSEKAMTTEKATDIAGFGAGGREPWVTSRSWKKQEKRIFPSLQKEA